MNFENNFAPEDPTEGHRAERLPLPKEPIEWTPDWTKKEHDREMTEIQDIAKEAGVEVKETKDGFILKIEKDGNSVEEEYSMPIEVLGRLKELKRENE